MESHGNPVVEGVAVVKPRRLNLPGRASVVPRKWDPLDDATGHDEDCVCALEVVPGCAQSLEEVRAPSQAAQVTDGLGGASACRNKAAGRPLAMSSVHMLGRYHPPPPRTERARRTTNVPNGARWTTTCHSAGRVRFPDQPRRRQ